MTIYWERCSICGRHYPTKTCWLHPELSVCPHCCLLCPERGHCPQPAWYPNLRLEAAVAEAVEEAAPRPAAPAAAARAAQAVASGVAAAARRAAARASEERERKIRKLEELLRRLEGG